MKVAFRKLQGEVIAVFPEEKWNEQYLTSYMHIGQHGGCCPSILQSEKAAEEEYAPLLEELKSIGYEDLQIV